MKHQRITRSVAWAWAIPGRTGLTLCNWAEPNKEVLERESAENDHKPSPDAVIIKVALIPFVELSELLRREKDVAERVKRCAAIEHAAKSAVSELEL